MPNRMLSISLLAIVTAATLPLPAVADHSGCGDEFSDSFSRPGSDSCAFSCHADWGLSAYAESFDQDAWVYAKAWCDLETSVRTECSGYWQCTSVTPPGMYATQNWGATCEAGVTENWPSGWRYWCSDSVHYSTDASATAGTLLDLPTSLRGDPRWPSALCDAQPSACAPGLSFVHGSFVDGVGAAQLCEVSAELELRCAPVPVRCDADARGTWCRIGG